MTRTDFAATRDPGRKGTFVRDAEFVPYMRSKNGVCSNARGFVGARARHAISVTVFCAMSLSGTACAVSRASGEVARPANSVEEVCVFAGRRCTPVSNGASITYDAVLGIQFSENIGSAKSISYSIRGSDNSELPSSLYVIGYGKQLQVTANHKRPGVVYTINITTPVRYRFTFTTPPGVAIPKPTKAVHDPYYYGALEHPFPYSLGDVDCSSYACIGGNATLRADSLLQIERLCRARLGNVRMEYIASQILTKNGKETLAQPAFARQDAIMDALAKCNITEMPIIEQYAAGSIFSGGKGQATPFQSPADYAAFAKIVTQHVTAKYPQIKRVELFNEPNNHGWGSFPVAGSYAKPDESGIEAAIYMKAAYSAVKDVSRKMIVVGPALATGGRHTDSRKFLQTMLANGCGPGTCYDVLSVHNYDWEDPTNERESEATFGIYKTLQKILAQNGHPGVHVMLTEWGFSTAENPYGFDPRVQARYLAIGLNRMLADPTVDGVTYVNIVNPSCKPSCSADFWGRTALTDATGAELPGFATLKEFTTQH